VNLLGKLKLYILIMLQKLLPVGKKRMSKSSQNSLAKVILNRSILFFLISTTILLSVMLYFFQKEIMYSSMVYGDLSLKNGALKIEHHISKQYSFIEELDNSINYHLSTGDDQFRDPNYILNFLEDQGSHKTEIDGVFAIFEPNAFNDADSDETNELYHNQDGRFTPLITANSKASVVNYANADYYLQPKETHQSYVSNPFNYTLDGKTMSVYSITFPIVVDSEFIGVVGCMINIDRLFVESDKIKIYDGYSTVAILDNEGNYLTHSHTPELIGKNLSEDCLNPAERLKNLQLGKIDQWFEGAVGGITNAITINEHQTPWQFQAKVHAKHVFKNVITAAYWIFPIIILCIVLFYLIIRWLINSNIKPLTQLSLISEEIANGDLTQTVDVNSNYEIGVLAKSFQAMITKLQNFINEIQVGIENINSASQQLSTSSHTLSTSTTEQASVGEEISCNMEEMTASVQQNATKSQHFRLASLSVAEKMAQINKEANSAAQLQVDVAAQVKVVNEIAQNIKILSLNAAVEAARAGEHGRGFAVVAREVQKLSETTTSSSAKITDKIALSTEKVTIASELIKEINPMLDELSDGSEVIDTASQEQAQNIQQVTNAAQMFNNTTQTNAASAEELASTSEELSNQAERLTEMARQFKI